MDEKFLQQCFAEMQVANEEAMAILVAALSRQLNAETLYNDLSTAIASAQIDRTSPLALKIAKRGLEAAESEWRQAQRTSQ
jgi:hypothetical protein